MRLTFVYWYIIVLGYSQPFMAILGSPSIRQSHFLLMMSLLLLCLQSGCLLLPFLALLLCHGPPTSGLSRHLCLLPDLEGRGPRGFTVKSVTFSEVSFYSSCSLVCSVFSSWVDVEFSQRLFCGYWGGSMVLPFMFVNVVKYSVDFQMLNLANLYLGINSTWSWCSILFMYSV